MDKKNALNKLMNICSRKEKCSFDILKKLSDWEFNDSDSYFILEQLKSNKYIDDKRYAESFANDKFKFNYWGKVKIAYALRQKNIKQEYIDYALAKIDYSEYYNLVRQEILKKEKSIKTTDIYKKRSKILMFAKSRGYEIDIINKILDSIS